MRRPIRPQLGSRLRFGSSQRAGPAMTNSESGRYRAVGEQLAELRMVDF